MTDAVTISPGRTADSRETNRMLQYSGHAPGWVVPDTMELLADIAGELAAGPYNAFDATYAADSLDVTIETGEAIVGGAGVARDTTTTVTLPTNTAGMTVSVGWDPQSQDTVMIRRNAGFADEPTIPLWTFDTDDTGVTAATDQRHIGEEITVRNRRYEGNGVAVDRAADADTVGGRPPGVFLRSDQADTMGGTLTIDTGDSAVAIDLSTGDAVGVDDIEFAGGANPQIKIPEALDIFDQQNSDGLGTWSPGVGLNLWGNELVNFRIDNKSARPNDPSPGTVIYRDDLD